MNLQRNFSNTTPDALHITSYNTLSDCHISKCTYPYVDDIHLYRGEDKTSQRHQLFMRELDHLSSHIYCFQEVCAGGFLNLFRSDLSERGFDLIFEKKTDVNEGCAIAYNNQKFQCLETEKVVFYEEMLKLLSTQEGDSESTDKMKTLKQCQLGMYAVFKDIQKNKIFIIGNTHITYKLLSKPDLQALQGSILMQHAHKLRLKVAASMGIDENSIPLVICGDFNNDPTHFLYRLMTKSRFSDEEFEDLRFTTYEVKNDRKAWKKVRDTPSFICEKFKDVLYNPVALESAYQKFNGSEPSITSSEQVYCGTLDYIFVTPNIEVLGVLDINDDVAKEFEKGGPTSQFASDHLPIAAQLQFL